MTEINKIECDYCGNERDKIIFGGLSWIKYSFGVKIGKDFCCHDCLVKYVIDENNVKINNPITDFHDTMNCSDIPNFFKNATGRQYNSAKEICINDIRRMLMLYHNMKIKEI